MQWSTEIACVATGWPQVVLLKQFGLGLGPCNVSHIGTSRQIYLWYVPCMILLMAPEGAIHCATVCCKTRFLCLICNEWPGAALQKDWLRCNFDQSIVMYPVCARVRSRLATTSFNPRANASYKLLGRGFQWLCTPLYNVVWLAHTNKTLKHCKEGGTVLVRTDLKLAACIRF